MNREEVISILSTNEILPANKFGQNFLCDDKVIDRIIEASEIEKGDKVLEIGPGIGALTEKLSGMGADLTAVEIDLKLASYLTEALPDVDIIRSDYLKLSDYGEDNYSYAISNIPYYVMTPIIIKLITDLKNTKKMTFMIEEEAMRRIDAPQNTKQYGPLSIMCSLYGDVKKEFSVSRECFHPKPHTTSAVITFTRKDNGFYPDSGFYDFLSRCFSQRRKKLINNCPFVKDALKDMGKDPDRVRAEDLCPSEYATIYGKIHEIML